MASSSQKVKPEEAINPYAKQGLHRLTRTGNLFVIHFTKEMFDDNESPNIYFHQCLETYVNILKQKLSHNKDDYMGLMFCNTKDSDEGAENILTVQKLSGCITNMYAEIMKIYNKDISYYKNQICDNDCSIANVLLHAIRAYDTVTAKMIPNVIFITCDDNPASNDSKERHRIRLNAKNYKDLNVKLKIVGMGKNWNYDIFYKEIEMLAEKTAGRDFKRTNLKDLEENIIFKAHVMASLEFRIKDSAKIKVTLQGFHTRRTYIKTKFMGKDTNEPLDSFSWYSFQADEDNDDEDEHTGQDDSPEVVYKMQRFGGRDIVFTHNEVRSLHVMKKPGIDLLCFKPRPKEDPLYHLQPVLFVGCHEKSSNGELKFFVALLRKMAEKNIMAVCTMTFKLNARTRLYTMWPCLELGGFYLYRLPFKEDIRINVESIAEKYIFNDDKPPPISEEKVEVMKGIVQALTIEKYPISFSNTRQQRLLKSVEAVALELPPVDLPEDDTLPDFDAMRNKLNEMNLIERYNEVFEEIVESTKSRAAKVPKLDEEHVNNIIKEGNFNKLTAVVLKSVLRTLGQSSSGNKAELINKLNEYKKKHFKE